MPPLSLERIPVGAIGTICYLVSNAAGETVLIDPGAEPDKILKRLQDKERTPVAILLTHGHYDHIEAIANIKEHYDIPVMGSREDEFLLEGSRQSVFVGRLVAPVLLDRVLLDGDVFELLDEHWRVIATPGHTPGSVTFIVGDWAFTGDTLFAHGSVGRTDLWGGSAVAIKASITQKLFMTLPDSMIVYPGHGDSSTIGKEKASHLRYQIFG